MWVCGNTIKFYDNSILSGTKIDDNMVWIGLWFYDNSILSGTKIGRDEVLPGMEFYDNSILSGTKIESGRAYIRKGFTITQFFQVLKSCKSCFLRSMVLR